MRSTLATLCALLILNGCERRGNGEVGAKADRPASDTITATTTTADTAVAVNWQPAPPGLPAGARFVVIEGDPAKAGAYTLKLELPAGYEVRPHWHPMTEHVKVLEGGVLLGRGKQWDEAKMKPLGVGDEAEVAPKEPHYLKASERTVVESRGTGPIQVTYVNPADDPRKKPIP